MKGFIYLSFHIIIKYRCTLFYPPKGILGRLLFIKTGKNSHIYIYIYIYVCVCRKKMYERCEINCVRKSLPIL